MASMGQQRFAFGVCHFGNFIYSLGGAFDSSIPHNSCERYNIKENTWEEIAPLPSKRYAMSCIILKKRYIYAVGGFEEFLAHGKQK